MAFRIVPTRPIWDRLDGIWPMSGLHLAICNELATIFTPFQWHANIQCIPFLCTYPRHRRVGKHAPVQKLHDIERCPNDIRILT